MVLRGVYQIDLARVVAQGCPQVGAWGDFSTHSGHLRHYLFTIYHILPSSPT